MSNQEGSLGEEHNVNSIKPSDTIEILLELKETGKNLCTQLRPSIYKVPCKLRDKTAYLFAPHVVSIGPLHRNHPNVQAFEERKTIYLHNLLDRLASPQKQFESCFHHLLSRLDSPPQQILESSFRQLLDRLDSPPVQTSGSCFHLLLDLIAPPPEQVFESCLSCMLQLYSTPQKILESCLQTVNAKIATIRACYARHEIDANIDDNEFAKMMVMDACFILEFLWSSLDHKDSISGNVSLTESIYRDLILLENQIPFFVLQDIFDCTIKSYLLITERSVFSKNSIPINPSLDSIILERLKYLNPFQVTRDDVDVKEQHHLLGFLHSAFHPPNYDVPDRPQPLASHKLSVVQLDKVGVKFKPIMDEDWCLGMEIKTSRFTRSCTGWGKVTVNMPILRIEGITELFLRNIIAYEQCTPRIELYFTSYAIAMDMLVDTTDDISKLVESKVIVNHLASHEDAKNMFNGICHEVVAGNFYFKDEWVELEEHYNHYWPKHITGLKRAYFSSPWKIIALLAGFILFTLTMVQTVFTIKAA